MKTLVKIATNNFETKRVILKEENHKYKLRSTAERTSEAEAWAATLLVMAFLCAIASAVM